MIVEDDFSSFNDRSRKYFHDERKLKYSTTTSKNQEGEIVTTDSTIYHYDGAGNNIARIERYRLFNGEVEETEGYLFKYDDSPSAFVGDYFLSNVLSDNEWTVPLFYSANNIVEHQRVNTLDTWKQELDYSYSDIGYPTRAAVSNFGSINTTFETWEYAYECGSSTIDLPFSPVSEFSYGIAPVTIGLGNNYTSSAPSYFGTRPITFSIDNLSEVGDFVTIDPSTGIFVVDGSKTVPGTFTITVKAANASSEQIDNIEFTVLVETSVVGKWSLSTATLVDGNIPDTNSTDMVILNGGIDPNSGTPVTVTVPAGNISETKFFVNAILSDLAPCTDPNTPVTYQINMKSGGILAFICTSEGDTSEDNGTWVLANDYLSLTLTVSSPVLGYVVVSITDLVVDSSGKLSGYIDSYPMVVDAALPIGANNLQFISFDVVLQKFQ